jgi:phosphoserine phosphatase
MPKRKGIPSQVAWMTVFLSIADIDERVDDLCARARAGSLGPRPAAALDFDNSCIRGDVGETLHHHLCDELGYALDGQFWDVLDPEDGRDRLRAVWTAFKGGEGDLPDSFRDDLSAVYARRFLRLGRRSVYGWAASMHAGMRPEEVAEAARANVLRHKSLPVTRLLRGTTPDGLELSRSQGMRSRPAVQRWVNEMDAAGIGVWVVSATNIWAVTWAAEHELGVPSSRVIGNACEVQDGRITARPVHPVIYKEGKLQAFRAATGVDPVFAIGDTSSDEALLRHSQGLSLLVDRGDTALLERGRAAGWLVTNPRHLDGLD